MSKEKLEERKSRKTTRTGSMLQRFGGKQQKSNWTVVGKSLCDMGMFFENGRDCGVLEGRQKGARKERERLICDVDREWR